MYKYSASILSLVILLLYFSACEQNSPTSKTINNPLQTVLHLDNTDTLAFPVIDNYELLDPIFHQNNDTTYVINFWATWCAPCVKEFPYFEQLAQETKGEAISFLMVSLDFDKDIRTKLPRFIKERNVQLPVASLIDPKPHIWIERIEKEWEGSIPITIIYKNDQRHFFNQEFESFEELQEMVNEIAEK